MCDSTPATSLHGQLWTRSECISRAFLHRQCGPQWAGSRRATGYQVIVPGGLKVVLVESISSLQKAVIKRVSLAPSLSGSLFCNVVICSCKCFHHDAICCSVFTRGGIHGAAPLWIFSL